MQTRDVSCSSHRVVGIGELGKMSKILDMF